VLALPSGSGRLGRLPGCAARPGTLGEPTIESVVRYGADPLNVLFLSLDFVFPADRGLRVRSLSQLRVLSSIEAINEITLLALSETKVGEDRLRALERELPKVRAEPPVVQPTHMRRSPRHLPRLLGLRLLGVPYLVAKCDNADMHGLVDRHLRTGRYDVVYIGHLGMAAYLASARRLAPQARVVLEQHNVEWEIFKRLAPSFRFAMRQFTRLEASALRRYERRVLRAVDSVIAISDADALAFEQLAGVRAVVVPTYIETTFKREETTRRPALGYTGLLGWQPNTQGLDWFCKDVWPLVRARVPDATLTIAGPGLGRLPDGSLAIPSNWSLPGITTVGYVDELEEIYRGSVAMVAPILGGSGVRMKLLEAMRAGMPTVTTTDGAAGLAVADGREMFIADEPSRFADCVARVLSDSGLRERLRVSGYAYLEAHHSIGVARGRLEESLARVAAVP
jgi:polysaccharide biosynthesis protein PslH